MTRAIVIILCCAWALSGCKSKEDNHFDRRKMQAVLTDICIAENASARQAGSHNFAGSKDMDTLAVYYRSIFAHHGITGAQFRESWDWYAAHQEELDSVLADVIASAQKLLDSADIHTNP